MGRVAIFWVSILPERGSLMAVTHKGWGLKGWVISLVLILSFANASAGPKAQQENTDGDQAVSTSTSQTTPTWSRSIPLLDKDLAVTAMSNLLKPLKPTQKSADLKAEENAMEILGKNNPNVPDWVVCIDPSAPKGEKVYSHFIGSDFVHNDDQAPTPSSMKPEDDENFCYLRNKKYIYVLLIVHNSRVTNQGSFQEKGGTLAIQGPVSFTLSAPSKHVDTSNTALMLSGPLTIAFVPSTGEASTCVYNGSIPVTASNLGGVTEVLSIIAKNMDYKSNITFGYSGVISDSIPLVLSDKSVLIGGNVTLSLSAPSSVADSQHVAPVLVNIPVRIHSGPLTLTDSLPGNFGAFFPDLSPNAKPSAFNRDDSGGQEAVTGVWENRMDFSSGFQYASLQQFAGVKGSGGGAGQGVSTAPAAPSSSSASAASAAGSSSAGGSGSVDTVNGVYVEVTSLQKYSTVSENLFSSLATALGLKASSVANSNSDIYQPYQLTFTKLDKEGEYYMAMTRVGLNPNSLNRLTIVFPDKMVAFNGFDPVLSANFGTMDASCFSGSLDIGPTYSPYFKNIENMQVNILFRLYPSLFYDVPPRPFRKGFISGGFDWYALYDSFFIFGATPVLGSNASNSTSTGTSPFQSLYFGGGIGDFWSTDVGCSIGWGWNFSTNFAPQLTVNPIDFKL
jgi:hypothetical protein